MINHLVALCIARYLWLLSDDALLHAVVLFATYGLLGRGLSPLYLYLREKDNIGEKSDNSH